MPSLEAPLLECLIIESVPNCPKEKTAIALTLAVNAVELGSLETYYGSTSSPAFRLCFGQDEAKAQIAALMAQLETAQAEVQRYRAAYDKNPPPEAGRASLLEVD